MNFEIRLVWGSFLEALIRGRKSRNGKYLIAKYTVFRNFLKALHGKETECKEPTLRTTLNSLTKCKHNSSLMGKSLRNDLKKGFGSRHKAMREFLKDCCDPGRIKETVAILKIIIANDSTISKDENLFVSYISEDGTCQMTTANEILKAEKLDFALLLLSLSYYIDETDNRDGKSTVIKSNWNQISDFDYFKTYLINLEDLENGVPLINPTRIISGKSEDKGITTNLCDMDFNALKAQIDANSDLAGLISNTQRNRNLYVETGIYRETLKKVLEKRRVMLSGPPGSGKTLTSEMVALKMAGLGYRVSFLYGTADVNDFFLTLKSDRNKGKQFILIDDCMGQAFFELADSSSSNPLRNLIAFVESYPKQYSILLNSRINIIETAMDYRIGTEVLRHMKDEGRFVQADGLSLKERALILKSHLIARTDREHYNDIAENRELCLKIINHEPFLPRVIDHMTMKSVMGSIRQSGDYAGRILDAMNNPADVWNRIYSKTSPAAKALLMALFTLTDTGCDESFCRTVFNHIVGLHNKSADLYGLWSEAVGDLNESMITLKSIDAKRQICFYDPSVRDFLRKSVYTDSEHREKLVDCLVYFEQIGKIFSIDGLPDRESVIKRLTESGELRDLRFMNERHRYGTIVYYASSTGTLLEEYREFFAFFRKHPHIGILYPETIVWPFVEYAVFRLFMENPAIPRFYYGDGIPEDLVMELTEYMKVEEICEYLPEILSHANAFAFDIDESFVTGLLRTAALFNMSAESPYLVDFSVDSLEKDGTCDDAYVHKWLMDFCVSDINDYGGELSEEIKDQFIMMVYNAPVEEYSMDVESLRSIMISSNNALSVMYSEGNAKKASEEEIAAMFREPFPEDK